MVKYSFLDLAHVTSDSTISKTFQKSIACAQHAEKLGYTRYWFAEHHNMENVASSATSILIGHIASKTNTIRVGSGGIMLPNHSPLIVAETFGTLGTLFPNRIDLGLGRAPGTDQQTAHFIRPDFLKNAQEFPKNLKYLQQFFSEDNKHSSIRAIPGEGIDIPIWILGSSTDSAHVAASFGLPYAFASHFAPASMTQAFHLYENNFSPQKSLEKPYKMAAANIIIADSLSEAQSLATSFYRMFLGILRDERIPMLPPVKTMDGLWNVNEEAYVRQMTSFSFIGTKETVKRDLINAINRLQIQELIMSCPIYYLDDKLKSMQYLAEIMQEISIDR